MKQTETDNESIIKKDNFNKEQNDNYEAFISFLADIVANKDDNKDIDKHFI